MPKMLNRREYFVISTSIAVLGLVALTVGLYYLFKYVNSNSVVNIVFYAAIWVFGVSALLRRYSKRRALKSNSS
jgi:membrane protein YdbS with pleckstrin-like domain